MASVMHLKMPMLASSICGWSTQSAMSTPPRSCPRPRSLQSRGCQFHARSSVVHKFSPDFFNMSKCFSCHCQDIFAWTDSTIVLSWLTGNPRRFNTYVGNRVSSIVDQIPPDRWNHVLGIENPADCASRGVSPLELLEYELWWKSPPLLKLTLSYWPNQHSEIASRGRGLVPTIQSKQPVVPLDH